MPELLRVERLSRLDGLQGVTARIEARERRIGSRQPRQDDCERLATSPGAVRVTATAVVANRGPCPQLPLGAGGCGARGPGPAAIGHGWAGEDAQDPQAR